MFELPILGDLPSDPAENNAPIGYSKGTYAFISLGCPKNLVDSERMLGSLSLDGYSLVANPEGADFVIVNTCGFLAASRAESVGVIRDLLDA